MASSVPAAPTLRSAHLGLHREYPPIFLVSCGLPVRCGRRRDQAWDGAAAQGMAAAKRKGGEGGNRRSIACSVNRFVNRARRNRVRGKRRDGASGTCFVPSAESPHPRDCPRRQRRTSRVRDKETGCSRPSGEPGAALRSAHRAEARWNRAAGRTTAGRATAGHLAGVISVGLCLTWQLTHLPVSELPWPGAGGSG